MSTQPDIGKKYYGIADLVLEVSADTDEPALIDQSVAAQVTKSELQTRDARAFIASRCWD